MFDDPILPIGNDDMANAEFKSKPKREGYEHCKTVDEYLLTKYCRDFSAFPGGYDYAFADGSLRRGIDQ